MIPSDHQRPVVIPDATARKSSGEDLLSQKCLGFVGSCWPLWDAENRLAVIGCCVLLHENVHAAALCQHAAAV